MPRNVWNLIFSQIKKNSRLLCKKHIFKCIFYIQVSPVNLHFKTLITSLCFGPVHYSCILRLIIVVLQSQCSTAHKHTPDLPTLKFWRNPQWMWHAASNHMFLQECPGLIPWQWTVFSVTDSEVGIGQHASYYCHLTHATCYLLILPP